MELPYNLFKAMKTCKNGLPQNGCLENMIKEGTSRHTKIDVDVICMGCSKNLVDSEMLARQLEMAGYRVRFDPKRPQSRIVIINTCGFIGDAKEESVNEILKFVQKKRNGEIDRLLVMGCLAERYMHDLEKEIPEVDNYYGKFAWRNVLNDLGVSYNSKFDGQHKLSTPKHYAYVKIAEGCNRHCAYCAIPLITGSYKSRTIEEIVNEVKWLVSKGVKEFQIIAQDLTYYGKDIYGEYSIAKLVEAISDIDGVKWIRLHYAYPTDFPLNLLPVIRERENVCKYLDIALQHISDGILKDMRRHITKKETYDLIEEIRKEVPDITLRTTLMVGFPNETEEQFKELLSFVKETKFDRMGAFKYSEEEGTPAAKMNDNVPEEVKERRLDELMGVQEKIMLELNEEKCGKTFKVIIDGKNDEYYVGRTEYDSPEVDSEVMIKIDSEKRVKVGEMYDVRIVDTVGLDLIGELV